MLQYKYTLIEENCDLLRNFSKLVIEQSVENNVHRGIHYHKHQGKGIQNPTPDGKTSESRKSKIQYRKMSLKFPLLLCSYHIQILRFPSHFFKSQISKKSQIDVTLKL